MKLITAIFVFISTAGALPHGGHPVLSGSDAIKEITQHGLAQDLPGTTPAGDLCLITYTAVEAGLELSIKLDDVVTVVVIQNDAQIERKASKLEAFTRNAYWFVADGAKKMVSVSKANDACDFDLVLWTGTKSPVTCRFRE